MKATGGMEQAAMNPEQTLEAEPRDRTKLLWAGVLALIVIMAAGIWFSQRPKPNTSSVRARHILIKYSPTDLVERNRAMERALEIRERLLNGGDFAALARQYSEDPMSSRRGGDLGWAPKGVFDKAFEEYCWQGEVGKISDIISTQFGFHIIQITDRHVSEAELYEQELDRRTLEEEKKRSGAGGAPASPSPDPAR